MSRYKEIDLNKVKTVSIHQRGSKINIDQAGKPVSPGSTFQEFMDSLPKILIGSDFRELVKKTAEAVNNASPVLLMIGAHVIKTGLNPVLIDLLERGFIQGIAMNGACAIHDIELAYFGETSEDVNVTLKNGTFGMAEETAEIINNSAYSGMKQLKGFGESLGERIQQDSPKYFNKSLIGEAFRLNVPVTIHTALGTDIVHQHPTANGSAIGDVSMRDFRIFCNLVSHLDSKSAVLLFGSAVILPEVFLKALNVARNCSADIKGFTTACFDMIQHYRPSMNFLRRPTSDGGKGFQIIGHHEIMIPMFAAALKEFLRENYNS